MNWYNDGLLNLPMFDDSDDPIAYSHWVGEDGWEYFAFNGEVNPRNVSWEFYGLINGFYSELGMFYQANLEGCNAAFDESWVSTPLSQIERKTVDYDPQSRNAEISLVFFDDSGAKIVNTDIAGMHLLFEDMLGD